MYCNRNPKVLFSITIPAAFTPRRGGSSHPGYSEYFSGVCVCDIIIAWAMRLCWLYVGALS